ncbi:DinB family protein [Peribacillus butanolivorans]|uniref:DinB family protein n=1 Tax=Peribacillus butanolivorans TaxID=421767 RepID=UPI002E2376C2|nr:DinB family protein [Peribacillus butanolivorans]
MSELEVSQRPIADKWSKKEILGHLCDSAINNLERFIKIQYEEQPFVLTPYNQDQWVDIQDYQDISIEEIINLWCGLNKKIIKIIAKTPNEKLAFHCDIGNNQMKTLEWLIHDYLEHMEHHLKNQIFN